MCTRDLSEKMLNKDNIDKLKHIEFCMWLEDMKQLEGEIDLSNKFRLFIGRRFLAEVVSPYQPLVTSIAQRSH